MRDERDMGEGSPVWGMADALTAGRSVDWDAAANAAPPAQESLLQELMRVARVFAAHEERQRATLEPGAATAAADRATHGDAWGPLVIVEQIGEGAFGEVYRAREPRLDRQVALKFFRPHRLLASQAMAEVIEEGRLLARVRHPNVVTVHGADHLDGRFGIWMEFIEGSTLEEMVVEQGPLTVGEATAIGRDLCGALAAIHRAGILHRDIKARNVMRETDGRVVLMDLGVSCEVARETPLRPYGTPLYASPETLLANESSERSDIYSLGVLLYFLVSGRHPVEGATLAEIREAHVKGRASPLVDLCPGLPAEFLEIVERSLARHPDDRFATATDLERALADAVTGTHESDGRDGGEQTAFRARTTTGDRQAYNQYLQGRHFWDERYSGGLPQALACFRRSIEIDPRFALAYVGIADCLNLLSYDQFIRPRGGFAEARAAAERALELAPDLGEPLVSLGWISTFHDWDFVAAERYFRQAIQLCPQYGLARQWLALMLMSRERYDEALTETASARELDFASFRVGSEGITLFMAGRHDEAEQFFRMALETDPDAVNIRTTMGLFKIFSGGWEDAERHLRRAIAASGGEFTFAVSNLAVTLALAGLEDEAIEQIEAMEELAQRRYVSHYHRLAPWIALGRYDKWGPMLDTAIEERDPYLVYLKATRRYLDWLDDPRLAGPLRQVGLLD